MILRKFSASVLPGKRMQTLAQNTVYAISIYKNPGFLPLPFAHYWFLNLDKRLILNAIFSSGRLSKIKPRASFFATRPRQ
jgi:hypothetical protein